MNATFEKRLKFLRPMAMPAELEPVARQLGQDVCCGTRAMWPIDGERLREEEVYRADFYRLAHEGMWSAQERFLHRISTELPLSAPEGVMYRTAMDSIAWQLLQKQLCFARRVYRDQVQPSVQHSNLRSVVTAANWMREQSPSSMPLLTDLTTFVQIGDIISLDPGKGISIVEVKEGKHNHKVLDLAHFYKHAECERFKGLIQKTESAATFKQFERVLRQMDRMEFAKNVLRSKLAHDPDSGQAIRIPEAYVPIAEWGEELNAVVAQSKERGWAIDVIDECLFIGCYSKPDMIRMSPAAFLPWLDEFAGDEYSPVFRLIDCSWIPLALPLYLLPLPEESLMDLMFGRLHVCMGISLPGLVGECGKHGIEARPATKRERRIISESRGNGVAFQGRPLVLQRDGRSMIVADGIFMRMLCHFQRPISLLSALLDLESEKDMS